MDTLAVQGFCIRAFLVVVQQLACPVLQVPIESSISILNYLLSYRMYLFLRVQQIYRLL